MYFGGKQPGQRGRGALGKTPALVAVSLSEEGKPDQASFRVVEGFTLAAVKDWAEQALTTGMSLASDGLACFRAVSEVGIQHSPVVMSQDLSQRDKGAFAWVNTVIGNLKTALLGTYHHVSQKYLQRYLAEFEYRFNRRYDLKTILPRLPPRGDPHPRLSSAHVNTSRLFPIIRKRFDREKVAWRNPARNASSEISRVPS